MTCQNEFFGKYRGKVDKNFDPLGLGRLVVTVADVCEEAWAMPCLPGAGPGVDKRPGVGIFTIPPEGANVWVDFERGDPECPVWSGGFWDEGDMPVPKGPNQPVTQVWAGDSFRLEILDTPGMGKLTLTITTANGDAVLKAGAESMELSFSGSTVSLGADGVTINNGNLKVLP